MSKLRALFPVALATLAASGAASQAPVPGRSSEATVTFEYQEMRAFAETRQAIRLGANPAAAYAAYLEQASPGFRGLIERFNVTVEKFVERVPRNEAVFDALPSLEDDLRSREPQIRSALEKLIAMAGAQVAIPVYYIVSSQTGVGGTPVPLNDGATQSWGVGLAVGVDPNASPEVRAAFPSEESSAAMADRIAQIVIHEGAHILQMEAEGVENYRSIYDQETGSMLAIAVREGCAEYLTYLASGWRAEERDAFARANQRDLWTAFQVVADEPPFSVPGWFDGASDSHPDWPFQIGYALGFLMCEAYHYSDGDPDARLPELFAIYGAEDLGRVEAAFEASLADL